MKEIGLSGISGVARKGGPADTRLGSGAPGKGQLTLSEKNHVALLG
jgi:hypothetical protein